MRPPGLRGFLSKAKAVSGLRNILSAGKRLPSKFKPKFSGKDFVRGVHNLEADIAKEFFQTLKTNFRKNTFGFSLGEQTRARKTGRYKNVPLINTREYVNRGIIQDGKSVRVREGLHRSGITYLELASIHEFGRRDKSIPARPVWRRTYDAFRPVAKKRILQFLYPKGKRR